MGAEVGKQCAVCAWRGDCQKKHTIRDDVLQCPDFSRDALLPPDDRATAPDRHRKVEDVFSSRAR